MRYRKLRIAWSVAWGVATVLLIALRVHGYWWTYDLIANGFYYGTHTYSVGFSRTLLLIPLWCVTVLGTSLALAPCRRYIPSRFTIPKRFSLRTLLIATTLVAVVLGLVVYETRQ
jgi:hypothetical protein